MSGPRKKGGHEEGGGHAPMWIVSFADMVILLMSFFVLMLVKGEQKTASNDDMLRVLASIKVGFGYVPKPNSKDPIITDLRAVPERSVLQPMQTKEAEIWKQWRETQPAQAKQLKPIGPQDSTLQGGLNVQ